MDRRLIADTYFQCKTFNSQTASLIHQCTQKLTGYSPVSPVTVDCHIGDVRLLKRPEQTAVSYHLPTLNCRKIKSIPGLQRRCKSILAPWLTEALFFNFCHLFQTLDKIQSAIRFSAT